MNLSKPPHSTGTQPACMFCSHSAEISPQNFICKATAKTLRPFCWVHPNNSPNHSCGQNKWSCLHVREKIGEVSAELSSPWPPLSVYCRLRRLGCTAFQQRPKPCSWTARPGPGKMDHWRLAIAWLPTLFTNPPDRRKSACTSLKGTMLSTGTFSFPQFQREHTWSCHIFYGPLSGSLPQPGRSPKYFPAAQKLGISLCAMSVRKELSIVSWISRPSSKTVCLWHALRYAFLTILTYSKWLRTKCKHWGSS